MLSFGRKTNLFKSLGVIPLISRFCQSKKQFGSSTLNTFERNVFKPKTKKDQDGNTQEQDFSDDIMKWAIDNEIEQIALICYPRN